MQLVFEQIRAGGDRHFGYLLGDRDARQGVLIDPSYSAEAFVARAGEQGLTVTHHRHAWPRGSRQREHHTRCTNVEAFLQMKRD